MIDVGIDDGDLVLVRKQDQANDGQIVVALVDDSATLKRFYRDPKNKRFRLHPENAAYEDIFVDHCDIQGVAVTVGVPDIDPLFEYRLWGTCGGAPKSVIASCGVSWGHLGGYLGGCPLGELYSRT